MTAAETKIEAIKAHLTKGGVVQLVTAYQIRQYDKRCVEMFKATANGAWVQRGKNWDCIDFTPVRFSK